MKLFSIQLRLCGVDTMQVIVHPSDMLCQDGQTVPR